MSDTVIRISAAPVRMELSAAQGAAGIDGPAGPNTVTSLTSSDGTGNLSLANVTTTAATVTGTLTAPHIHGNLAGSLYAHVRAGEDLLKGQPVYVSSFHAGTSTAIVSKADAGNAAKMPAVGIMDANVSANNNGHMVISGTITDLATNAYSINAELYVASGGGLTATPPTARAQPVARVERSNLNNGAILVKVNGLSASEATGSTLVRRTADGSANFVGINATSVTAPNIESTLLLQTTAFSATGNAAFQGSVEFQTVDYAYGDGAAEAHRTALGATTTGDAVFTAASAVDARTAIDAAASSHTHVSADISDATSAATANRVVVRDGSGSASFSGVGVSGLLDVGDFGAHGTTGAVVFGSGALVQFDAISYTYSGSAAAAHRTALGAGATGSALFTAANLAAVRSVIERRVFVKPSDTTKNNNAALAADPYFQNIPVDAGVYRIYVELMGTSNATAGLAARLSHPANSRPSSYIAAIFYGVATSGATIPATGTTTPLPNMNANGTRAVHGFLDYTFASSGTISVEWAQNAATVVDTILRAGSYLIIEKLS